MVATDKKNKTENLTPKTQDFLDSLIGVNYTCSNFLNLDILDKLSEYQDNETIKKLSTLCIYDPE